MIQAARCAMQIHSYIHTVYKIKQYIRMLLRH